MPTSENRGDWKVRMRGVVPKTVLLVEGARRVRKSPAWTLNRLAKREPMTTESAVNFEIAFDNAFADEVFGLEVGSTPRTMAPEAVPSLVMSVWPSMSGAMSLMPSTGLIFSRAVGSRKARFLRRRYMAVHAEHAA